MHLLIVYHLHVPCCEIVKTWIVAQLRVLCEEAPQVLGTF